ncbi:hypothetical protein ACFWNN_45425 [Lentzea sp. NPDC058450]|uniref:hypothetical protein n=1 Tax=Lentzea sp. NPDC058450 TaxID=3346505 RepID=UPI003655FF83
MRGLRELTALPSGTYDKSRIDWERLRQLARRVARETKAARGKHSVTVQVAKTREVRGGFLNLARRTETYEVPETRTVTDDYWVLERRFWKKDEKGSGSMADETTKASYLYCLGTDGSLFVRIEQEEEVLPKNGRFFVHRDEPSVEPMTDADVLLLDFEPKHESFGGRTSVVTNREPDKRRPRGASKGAGITAALTRLLAGRSS